MAFISWLSSVSGKLTSFSAAIDNYVKGFDFQRKPVSLFVAVGNIWWIGFHLCHQDGNRMQVGAQKNTSAPVEIIASFRQKSFFCSRYLKSTMNQQFYFFVTIPYIPLSSTLVIVTYYPRHLVVSFNFHILLQDVYDNSTERGAAFSILVRGGKTIAGAGLGVTNTEIRISNLPRVILALCSGYMKID
ncbi:hypothetical protein TNCV_1244491 [Trichonephila clavipes]|nr:hypothetical protein TNCV_1244491 [Trichonephila clavipes]